MSVVAARVYDNRIEMACDGLTKISNGHVISSYQKVIQPSNDTLIGTVGKAQNRYILERLVREKSFDFNKRKSEDIAWEFALKFRELSKEVENEFGDQTNFLFVHHGKLFYINRLYIEERFNFCAIGSGSDYAHGALEMDASPKRAVEIACKYHEYCGGNVSTFKTDI